MEILRHELLKFIFNVLQKKIAVNIESSIAAQHLLFQGSLKC